MSPKSKKIRKPVSLIYKSFTSFSDKIIRLIFKNLSYEEVSRNRLVSTKFNEIGKAIIHAGLEQVSRQNQETLKIIKKKVPRSKAAKDLYLKKGIYAGHHTILETLETMLASMKNSYRVSVDPKKTCFIPGIILDEIKFVLQRVNDTDYILNPHKELNKLHSMFNISQEHFEKRITLNFRSPILPVTPAVISELRFSLEKRGNKLKQNIPKYHPYYKFHKTLKKASQKIQRKTLRTCVKIEGFKKKISILKEEIHNRCVQNKFHQSRIARLNRQMHDVEDMITSSIITQASIEAGEEQFEQPMHYMNKRVACIRCKTIFKMKPAPISKIVFQPILVDVEEQSSRSYAVEIESSDAYNTTMREVESTNKEEEFDTEFKVRVQY